MVQFNEDVHITGEPPADPSGLPNRATRRLRVDSWERSNRPNGRAGDAIALHWMRPEAKAFIGWWDSTDPENPECKAWLGAHDQANNPEAAPHRHFSIEVTDSTGQMQTRLGIPYDEDQTNITTSSADFTVRGGVLRVPRSGRLQFSVDKDAQQGMRWEMRMDKDQNVNISRFDSPTGSPEPIAKLNAKTGRIEIQNLEVTDMVMQDRSTGTKHRLFISDGKLQTERLEDE